MSHITTCSERSKAGTSSPAFLSRRSIIAIVAVSCAGIGTHLLLRLGFDQAGRISDIPLWIPLVGGGLPLTFQLLRKAWNREFGSDLLAGISIVTSVLLGQYLAGAIVVLMLAGGEALERYAVARASSALRALASRMPSVAHRENQNEIDDVPLDAVHVGDVLLVYPHEICPVDGVVTAGRGVMDESYLTGEPFEMTKTVGSAVISGAKNGASALSVRATARAADSRYFRIMEVMRESDHNRPPLRRIGDRLGAIYTPLALGIACVAWMATGNPVRFLAVLVVATPCPLLIAIPVAIVGAVSLCAKRAIVVRSPSALEAVSECRTAIFDKTGTLTYGRPALTALVAAPPFVDRDVLKLVASLERYSKHPLARAVLIAAEDAGIELEDATEVSEPPGTGLCGVVSGRDVRVTSRTSRFAEPIRSQLPPPAAGLECIVLVDRQYAGTLQFRDAPRDETGTFIQHLAPRHHFDRMLIVSGDRQSEVQYLAEQVGISDVYAEQSPEQKLVIARAETALARTLYVGDGINDAPAMMAATVSIAIGQSNEVTTSSADVVIMDNSLGKVDEFIHIGRHMRRIALQSAIGGMALSLAGMAIAAAGGLTPVAGAVAQEVIDLAAVLNALRALSPPSVLRDS